MQANVKQLQIYYKLWDWNFFFPCSHNYSFCVISALHKINIILTRRFEIKIKDQAAQLLSIIYSNWHNFQSKSKLVSPWVGGATTVPECREWDGEHGSAFHLLEI